MTTATIAAPPAPTPSRPPLATLDDLDVCTCSVPLDGTRAHAMRCDLRYGAE